MGAFLTSACAIVENIAGVVERVDALYDIDESCCAVESTLADTLLVTSSGVCPALVFGRGIDMIGMGYERS